MGWQGRKQAVSKRIILKGKQQELVSSVSAFTNTGFSENGAWWKLPPDRMFPAASDELQTRDKQMWLRALAFGKNAHCQLEKHRPGQGLSCTEMKQVCGVTGGAVQWQRHDRGRKTHPVWTPSSRSPVCSVICLNALNWTSQRQCPALFVLYQNAHEVKCPQA